MLVLKRTPGTGLVCIQVTQVTITEVTDDAITLQRQLLAGDEASEPLEVRLQPGESATWNQITLKHLGSRKRGVKLGISAPAGIKIMRTELDPLPFLLRCLQKLVRPQTPPFDLGSGASR